MAAVAGEHLQSAEAENAADVAVRQDDDDEQPSVEVAFAGQTPPPWWQQVTARSVAASVVLGTVLTFMSMRIGLTAGVGPAFNIVASLLGFFVIKSWTRLLARFGVASQPFTRQENVVLQTCIISCATLSFYGGFSTYLLAMTETVAKSTGGTGTGRDVYELHTGKVMAFLGLVSYASLFCTLPLRKLMILDYKLMYPSGSAIAGIVNSFHTPAGAATAKLQVLAMTKAMVGSFMWASFQWIYTGGSGCGFQDFPMFGLRAYKQKFYFDFSTSLVGVGMICPVVVNFSMLFASAITSFFLWPALQSKKGQWYADPSPTNFRGINGYKVPMGIAMVLGDCLFQLGSITIRAAYHFNKNRQGQSLGTTNIPDDINSDEKTSPSYDDRRRNKIFLDEGFPDYVAVAGYIFFSAVSAIFVPQIFPQIRYYHVALLYAVAPIMAFCNSYASGLCDWSLASVYGKLAIFIVGAWVGEAAGGTIAGLAACGVMLMIIGNAAELMHDFKTGYLTLTSPVSMFISQAIGTSIGCLINPLVFLCLEKFVGKEHLGEAGSVFSAPLATAYRGLAVLSVKGIKILPKHSMMFCIAFFFGAFFLDCLAAIAKAKKWKKIFRNYDPALRSQEKAVEYTRALNAAKLEKIFAKPFVGAMDGHIDAVSCMAKNSNYLKAMFSGSMDGDIRLWDIAARKTICQFPGHKDAVRGLATSTDGDLLISCGVDSTVRLWKDPMRKMMDTNDAIGDASQPSAVYTWKHAFWGVDHQWDGTIFATVGAQVDIWDHNRSEPINSFAWGNDTVNSVRFNPGEPDVLITSANDRSLTLYDLRMSSPARKLIMKTRCNSVCWNPREPMNFTAANEDTNCYSFDARKLNEAKIVHKGHVSAVMDIDYSPTGREFVTGSYDRTVRIFNYNGDQSREIYHTKRMQRVFCVKYTYDGTYLVSGSDDTNLRLWKSKASEQLGVILPRERKKQEYLDAVKERYKHLPEIKRIVRHRHLPKPIYKAGNIRRTMIEADKRKEDRRRAHSAPGSRTSQPFRKRRLIKEVE